MQSVPCTVLFKVAILKNTWTKGTSKKGGVISIELLAVSFPIRDKTFKRPVRSSTEKQSYNGQTDSKIYTE